MTGPGATGATGGGAARVGDRDGPLRVALLSYRGKPTCGGQGIYVRNLSRELVGLGHSVEVLAGQPYPVVDEGVTLTRLPSLDLYRDEDPFRRPPLREHRDAVDLLETATMLTGGFGEPLTFSLRARRHLLRRLGDFDVVHDNQTLGYGLLSLVRRSVPLATTIHHPIQIDRRLELAAATGGRRWSLRRWYGFTRMQRRVARRLPHVVTVSGSSRRDIERELDVPAERITVIPVGVDAQVFRPDPRVPRVAGRLVTTASADVPLKGLVHLVRALAEVRAHRPAELVVIGRPQEHGPVATAVRDLGLTGAVRFVAGLTEAELVDEVRSAEVAVVPSLYEGFSLPAVEAMACGTPLVATTGGALPEVAGPDGESALLVPPGDAPALAAAVLRLLDDAGLRAGLAARGRQRVLDRFTWRAAATATAAHYRQILTDRQERLPDAAARRPGVPARPQGRAAPPGAAPAATRSPTPR